jgi:hypothetical protein
MASAFHSLALTLQIGPFPDVLVVIATYIVARHQDLRQFSDLVCLGEPDTARPTATWASHIAGLYCRIQGS